MVRPVARFGLLIGMFAFALPGVIGADKPTKAEIAKHGKAATAFVETPSRSTGTAFCVHPSGLFITNEHVIRGSEKAEITLVLNPALETQRTLKAKVVRIDKDTDLALLRVEGAKDLPSLSLGSIEGVTELADVIAFGFPLGKALSPNQKDAPAISVNTGTVTSLRYKDKQLQFLQIDVAVTFGNSGGPVLDMNGKVIGVVVSGIGGGGKGINQAIPVSKLERFLTKPDIAFTPPTINAGELGKPHEFKAGVAFFIPNPPKPSLKLILQAGDETPREFPMKVQDGVWVANATPVDKSAASRIEIAARIGTGMITGTTENRIVKVAGKPRRLNSIRRIDIQPKPSVLLVDGTTLAGEVTDLGNVVVNVGGQKIKVDLTKATQISVQVLKVENFTATVVATVDGKEVASVESRLIVRDSSTWTPVDPSSVIITPPTLSEAKVVKKLPEVFTDMAIGCGGRYLIFRMPKLKKLAVFDVNEARVTKYIPLTETDITFTAGLNCIVIGLKKSGKLERWSLTTFELEKSADPPFKEDIKSVVMGYGSNGPLVVNGMFLDLNTFQQLPILDGNAHERVWDPDARPIPSADGTVFGMWGTNSVTYVTEGNVVRRYEEGGLGHAIPGPDGRDVFTSRGIVTRSIKRPDSDDANYGFCLPALRGQYFLSIKPEVGGKGGGFTIYLRGLKQPIAKLENVDHGLFFDSAGGDAYHIWRRVYFVPDAKVIIVLPMSNDRVVMYEFDAEAALEKSDLKYLLVTSRPPSEVQAGKTLTYKLAVKSKSGGVMISLDSGPKGMTLSPEGTITWAVPADATGEQAVVLTVKDKSGEEVFHTFTLKVWK